MSNNIPGTADPEGHEPEGWARGTCPGARVDLILGAFSCLPIRHRPTYRSPDQRLAPTGTRPPGQKPAESRRLGFGAPAMSTFFVNFRFFPPSSSRHLNLN